MPVNLASRIPEGVSDEEAAFGMLGIIALHGIRCADLSFGSRVVVMGLGLLGLLTVQMLQAYGCEVIAFDPAEDKAELAKPCPIQATRSPGENSVAAIPHSSIVPAQL